MMTNHKEAMAHGGATHAPAVQPEPSVPAQHQARLFLDRLDDGYEPALRRGFDFLGPSGTISRHDRVVLKPNLTYPVYRPGVMTNPEAIEALVRYIKEFTPHITICEADSGGYNPFSMNEVFRATGLHEMARRYGVALVNLTEVASRRVSVRAGLRTLSVSVPRLLLEETDLFVTIPVPKIHMNTVVSVALKNQWGTIQQPAQRLRLHPYFREVVYELNRIYPRAIAVVDGRFGLTRSGPMRGDAVPLNWLMVCDDLFTTDFVVSQMLGLDPSEVPYLKWIFRRRPVQAPLCNTDWSQFADGDFYLKRAWTDYPGLFAFRSRLLAYLAYESPLARPLHWLLYRFRQPFY
jgi:uncharacterized protein (DUF362 family)